MQTFIIYHNGNMLQWNLSWPPIVPETVADISKWSAYTNVPQNNFQPYSYFISCLIYSQSPTSVVLNLYSI